MIIIVINYYLCATRLHNVALEMAGFPLHFFFIDFVVITVSNCFENVGQN